MKLPVNGKRFAVFIDGANLYATCKALGFDMDYSRLTKFFHQNPSSQLVRAFYYSAVHEDASEHQSVRPLLDWLDYNGFAVVKKIAKEYTDATGRRKIKGNMDIELAVDALEIADRIDEVIIFSGDGDFRPLVDALKRKGVRVNVASTIKTQPPMAADELRRASDHFIDLHDYMDDLERLIEPRDEAEITTRRPINPMPRRTTVAA